MPSGMELDLVDAMAVAVMCAQDRRMLVREPPPFERRAAGDLAERGEPILRERPALAPHRLDERPVLRIEVVAAKRRRLVEDGAGGIVSHPEGLVQNRAQPHMHASREQATPAPSILRRVGPQVRSVSKDAPGGSETPSRNVGRQEVPAFPGARCAGTAGRPARGSRGRPPGRAKRPRSPLSGACLVRSGQPRARARIMKLSKVYSATCHHRYCSPRKLR